MGRVISMAYNSAVASGKKVTSLLPYLDAAFISATVGDPTLLTQPSGELASAKDINSMFDNAISLVKTDGASEGKSDDQIRNDLLTVFRPLYNDYMSIESNAQAINKIAKKNNTAPFIIFMNDQINKATKSENEKKEDAFLTVYQ